MKVNQDVSGTGIDYTRYKDLTEVGGESRRYLDKNNQERSRQYGCIPWISKEENSVYF